MSGGNWKDMYQAAENGDLELVRYHLIEGVDPNYQHPEIMFTALFSSIRNGHADVASLLIERGADPCLKVDFKDMNAWQTAKYYQRHDMLSILGEEPKTTLGDIFFKILQKPFKNLFYY